MSDLNHLRAALFALTLTVSLGASACSGGSSADNSSPEADDAQSSAATDADQSTDEAPTTTAEPEVEDLPGLPTADGVEIEQLTPKSGGGARPLLEWTAIDGTDQYTLVVYDADGAPWWSWSGADTSVVIGGVETETEIGGPRAVEGARWIVMSFDAEGNMTGTSPRRAIEP